MRYALLLLFLFPACALAEEKPCFPVDRVLKVVDGGNLVHTGTWQTETVGRGSGLGK